MRLTEDKVKDLLRAANIPVPQGDVASTPEGAARIAADWSDGAVVKALWPTGRRGKAGAIRIADDASHAAAAAREILGSTANG